MNFTDRLHRIANEIDPTSGMIGLSGALAGNTAGWLMECLVRAGLEVETRFWREDNCYQACVTTNYDDGTLKHAVIIRDADLLAAVIEAAEKALDPTTPSAPRSPTSEPDPRST